MNKLINMMNKLINKKILFIIVFSLLIIKPAFAVETLYCGDGLLSDNEECDDGNFINRDGCSAYCTLEDMTPPEVSSVNIKNGENNVSTLTQEIIVHFNEAIDEKSINDLNLNFKQYNNPLRIEYDLSDNKTTLTIHLIDKLEGNKNYSLILKNFKDIPGNVNSNKFVSSFDTGDYIDIDPPNVVARPEGGEYHVGQSISLKAYNGKLTFSDEYLDEGAKIYYTLDGSIPTIHGKQFKTALSVKNNTTLKYFSVDSIGNKSEIFTQKYTFSCADRPHAKSVSAYPTCLIQDCGYGFILKNNVCVMNLSNDPDDYKANAATAPLFGSDTPVIISTRPALYITPEHHGVVPRPIHFVDLEGGTIIDLDRDTHIRYTDDSDFTGYLKPPRNMYTKSFPINFGYSFKSIFRLESAEGDDLYFTPNIKITIPFNDRYNEDSPITVFTFDPNTEEYYVHDTSLVSVNRNKDAVTIISDKTATFFIAQPGKNYNAIIFKDTVDHWAKNYIEQLYRWEYVKGRSKGVFSPDDILTRAEFTKIALNAIGEEVDPLENVEDSPFFDVALYAWYTPYIKRAKKLGLIKGYPDGSFKPDDPINKVEAVKMLMEGFKFDLHSIGKREDNFSDILTAEWYFPSINFALHYHLIDGIRLPNGRIQNDSFGPSRSMKRGEMAKLAVKAIELKKELEK